MAGPLEIKSTVFVDVRQRYEDHDWAWRPLLLPFFSSALTVPTRAMDNPAVTMPASARVRSLHRTTTNPSGEEEDLSSKKEPARLTKYDVGWRRIVRNFSPSWFSVTMGTGIVSTIFITFPWQAQWLYYLSIIFFVLNVCLFTAALLASVLRYTLYPEIWTVMIEDSTNSLFLGTIPMGFATIVEMWTFVCVPAWGEWAVWVAWGLWMVDALVAVIVTVSLGILLYGRCIPLCLAYSFAN